MEKVLTDSMVASFREGNEKAFNSLYDGLYQLVLYNASKIVEPITAEDVTALTFATLWRKRLNFNSLSEIRGFLMVASRNAAINALKKNKIHLHLVGDDIPEYSESDYITEIDFEALERIIHAIKELPQQQQNVLNLAFFEGLRNDEIAEILNISSKTVRNIKTNALSRLRNALKNPEDYAMLYAIITVSIYHA